MSNTTLPRGLRNNNPGNLRITSQNWQGKIPVTQNTDKAFEQFKNMAFGIRAMLKILINDIVAGRNTIRQIINKYAPPVENNTDLYIKHVATAAKVGENQPITATKSILTPMVKAMIIKENGAIANKHVSDADIAKAFEMIDAERSKKKLPPLPQGELVS